MKKKSIQFKLNTSVMTESRVASDKSTVIILSTLSNFELRTKEEITI